MFVNTYIWIQNINKFNLIITKTLNYKNKYISHLNYLTQTGSGMKRLNKQKKINFFQIFQQDYIYIFCFK